MPSSRRDLSATGATNAAPPIAKPLTRPSQRIPTNHYSATLTCFALLGKSPTGQELLEGTAARPPARFVEIYCRGEYLGRTWNLTDVFDLAYRTAELEALRKAAKTAARVAMKEGVAQSLEHNDQALLGALVRVILIGLLEQPDTRRWETLPHWLQAATVPCPDDLTEYDAVVKTDSGITLRTIHVTFPITQKRNRFLSLFRDLPRQPEPAAETNAPAPAPAL